MYFFICSHKIVNGHAEFGSRKKYRDGWPLFQSRWGHLCLLMPESYGLRPFVPVGRCPLLEELD